MLWEFLLYRPVDDETDIDNVQLLYDEMYGSKRKLDIVKHKVMEHLEGVEEAR